MKTLKIALTLAFIWGYSGINTVFADCPPVCCMPPYCNQSQCSDTCEPNGGQQQSDE